MTNDVTAGYIISDVERLRETMQRVTDFLLECAEQEPSTETIPLDTQNNLEYNQI
jgi:hypothetical protein